MSRKRLTREDSRDRTTQRLLDAARKLIAKRGLSDTTLEDIALAAGYTRGAFYSNFTSKSDLFIELLRRDRERTNAQLRALRDDSLPLEHIHQRIREIYNEMYQTNESFMNWTEARVLAVRDTKFRAKLDALLVERRAEVAALIEYVYGRLRIRPPLAPMAVAMGFNSLFEGVKLNMLASPGGMSSQDAESMLTLFVDSLMHVARLQGLGKATRRNGDLAELPPGQHAACGTE
jgi:AcrR family transcriptional regulator